MITCHHYFQRHSINTLLLMAVIAGLSCVTRYAGISIIAMGGLLMICDGRMPWVPKTARILLFGVIAILFPALNLYRNWRVTSTLTGYREKAIRSLGDNLHDAGSVFCDWMPFFNGRYAWATGIALLFIFLITGIFLLRLVRKRNFFSYDTIGISYFVTYALFILYTASVSRFQQLDSRLLSPLCIPWLWSSTCWMPVFADRLQLRRQKIAWGVVVVLAGACLFYGECSAFQFNWSGIKYAGIPGYTEDTWQQSATMAYVKAHKAELERAGTIYSSATDGLWFLARVSAELMPHMETQEDIDYMLREDHFTVIWFDDSVNTDLIDINFIRKHKQLAGELHFDDGAIYFFRTAAAVPAH